ncbi:MAG TPA: hypothetical protein VNO21_09560 [Polyangiaceae bacterium]|nr:hypothetical protein [Polyangiaceae bacterium]
MHVVIYLPPSFYSAIASAIVETLQTVNSVSDSPSPPFSFEFVANRRPAISTSGITFPAKRRPSRKMDVLMVLAGATADAEETLRMLDEEIAYAAPLMKRAQAEDAIIATHCAAPYLLAGTGMLDGIGADNAHRARTQAVICASARPRSGSRQYIENDGACSVFDSVSAVA